MPKVLNKRTDRIPTDAVYVGRPSKWGNPFRVGSTCNGRVVTQQLAVDAHRDWLLYSDVGRKLLKDIAELRGKDLVCWCAPLSCHANTLLELANA